MANYSKIIKSGEIFAPDAMQRFAFTGPVGTEVCVSINGSDDTESTEDYITVATTEDPFNVVDNVIHGMRFCFSNDVTVLY